MRKLLLIAILCVALLVHAALSTDVSLEAHLKRLHVRRRRLHQDLVKHLLMHLLQSLFAQEVHGLINFVGLNQVKSAILLARADLIEDVFGVILGPFQAEIHDGVDEVGLGESSLVSASDLGEVIPDRAHLNVARLL